MPEDNENTCDHRWDSDKEIRCCLHCGQIRTFPTRGVIGRIIWHGPGDKREPTDLPRDDKSCIAAVARGLRIKRAVKITGIPMPIIRAWVGRYTRAKAPKAAAAKLKLSITMERLIPLAPCFICNGELFADNPSSDDKHKPCYIDVGETRVELCGICADGIQRLFKLLGIRCRVPRGGSELSQPG